MEDPVNKIEQIINAPQWTAEDRKWLLQYLKSSDAQELKSLLLQHLKESDKSLQQVNPDLSQQMLHTIHGEIGFTGRASRAPLVKLYMRRIAAAAVVGLILTGAYLGLRTLGKERANTRAMAVHKSLSVPNDVLPGSNKAILTLADGSTVALDDAKNGALAQQGNTKVLKFDGKLAYNEGAGGKGEAGEATSYKLQATSQVSYNTIATPRGGQYQIVLPDGSQVWLNAASSLRFPTAFSGKERRVEVTGEAYFEIAKNASMPFKVVIPSGAGRAGSSEVEVLGTHFNITAYSDDALLKTTLLEGSVRFVNSGKASLLVPGQQSQLEKNGLLNVSDRVDLTEVMAWKNGIFHFEGADISTVMKQLSRWYDVEIVYGNKKINDQFYAEIPRNTRLSDALKALELTGKVDFKIENRKIIVNQ